MKTRLSAWKYVKNNKRAVAVLVTALALSFMAIYVIHVLLQTTVESFKPITLEIPKKLSYANLSDKAYVENREDYDTYEDYYTAVEARRAQLMESMRRRQGIENVTYTQILNCVYQAVVGQLAYEVPLLSPGEIQGFLDHMDAKLVEGRMPSGDGEVLADVTVMKNAGWKIGDWFMKDWYGENFRIVGVIRSKYLVSVGTPMGYTNSGFYLVVYNDETTTDLRSILKEEGIKLSEEDVFADAAKGRELFEKDVENVISTVVSAISLIVTIFLVILVMVSYVSFMRNRVNEYCLYASIGYGRGEIYGMILRETFLTFAMGSVIGLLASLGVGAALTKLVIEPKGLVGKLFYGDRILSIFGIYVFIMGMLQIPILACISRIKTIDAIED